MSRVQWGKAVDLTALLLGCLWYNVSLHSVLTRILS
jgi:hypothetical protein